MAELTPNAQAVLAAVNTLYSSPNVQDKEKASSWLGEFQKSIFAWETADQLLQLKNDVESTYFAAQTIRTKILYSFQELPANTRDSLKESLLTHIENFCGFSPAITIQLALAVCDLALQMHEWKLPAITFIEKYSKDKNALPYLLEILTVLPEEVNSRHLRLGANRRAAILDEMENSAPMVIEVIQKYMTEVADEQIVVKIFKCLGSWLYLGVFPGNHVARQNLLGPPFQVLANLNASSQLHQAATDCVCYALFFIDNIYKNSSLVDQIFHRTLELRQPYLKAAANEDTDKCLNLCRVFTEVAEALIEVTVTTPGLGHGDLEILDILLICVGHCQYEVADITFNYWYHLGETLYSFDHSKVNEIYSSFIARLIFALVRHCQMEPDHETVLDSSDDFADFRTSAADLVKDVVYMVGATECFINLFKMLTGEAQVGDDKKSADISWDVTESILFIMTAIAKNVDSSEVTVVPQVLQAIFSLPLTTHIAVRYTSIELVGELSSWIEKHPEMLDPTLHFLTSMLQTKELSSVAATSVQYLSEVCRSQMVKHHSSLIRLVQVADDLQVSSDATLGLLKGVANVLSSLPTDKARDALMELCQRPVAALNQICQTTVSQNQGNQHANYHEPILWLDRLAIIFRNFSLKRVISNGDTHPCKPVVEEMWPVFALALVKFQSDNRVVERWCRCVRFAIRCVKKTVIRTLLPPLATTISNTYKSSPHSCFLYLSSVLVDEYGEDESASNLLLQMLESFCPCIFDILNQQNGLITNPDTVDDLFRLCTRFVEQCPLKFLTHPICPPLLQCALEAIFLEHREANMSVSKFLKTVIEANSKVLLQLGNAAASILSLYGEDIVSRSLHASVLSIPSYFYPDIADLWWAIIQQDRQSFKDWLERALKNLPSDATLATATHLQMVEFLKDVSSAKALSDVSYLLRDFCRLYR